MLNIEGTGGVTSGQLREILYGPPASDDTYDLVPSMLWGQVLRPLSWLGLLEEVNKDERQWLSEGTYKSTALWHCAFKFARDQMLPPRTLH